MLGGVSVSPEDALGKLRAELADSGSPARLACDLSGQGRVEWGVALLEGGELIPLKAAYYLYQRKLGIRPKTPRDFNTAEARAAFEALGLHVEKRPPSYWHRVLQGSAWEPLPELPAFKIGHRYKRRHLHDHYGGQEQGGVITPSKVPAIFLITGDSGKQHGYSDIWHEDGHLSYFGEGQTGPMRFIKGNKAIRDHKRNGKAIHIFRDERKGWLSYTGEFELIGYDDKVKTTGRDGVRDAIVFELARCDLLNNFVADVTHGAEEDGDLEALYRRAVMGGEKIPGTVPSRKASLRSVYDRLRNIVIYVCKRAKGFCEGCNAPAPFKTESGRPFLEAHHIDHLSDGGLDHPINVAAVCPNCHRRAHHAVDRKSFNSKLREMVSAKEAALNHHGH